MDVTLQDLLDAGRRHIEALYAPVVAKTPAASAQVGALVSQYTDIVTRHAKAGLNGKSPADTVSPQEAAAILKGMQPVTEKSVIATPQHTGPFFTRLTICRDAFTAAAGLCFRKAEAPVKAPAPPAIAAPVIVSSTNVITFRPATDATRAYRAAWAALQQYGVSKGEANIVSLLTGQAVAAPYARLSCADAAAKFEVMVDKAKVLGFTLPGASLETAKAGKSCIGLIASIRDAHAGLYVEQASAQGVAR